MKGICHRLHYCKEENQLLVERPGEYFNLEWMGKVQINLCGKFNKKIHACCIVKFSFVPQKNLYSFHFCMYIFETGLETWHIYKLFRNKVTEAFLREIWLLSLLFLWEILHHQSLIILVIYDTNKAPWWPWWCICKS